MNLLNFKQKENAIEQLAKRTVAITLDLALPRLRAGRNFLADALNISHHLVADAAVMPKKWQEF